MYADGVNLEACGTRVDEQEGVAGVLKPQLQFNCFNIGQGQQEGLLCYATKDGPVGPACAVTKVSLESGILRKPSSKPVSGATCPITTPSPFLSVVVPAAGVDPEGGQLYAAAGDGERRCRKRPQRSVNRFGAHTPTSASPILLSPWSPSNALVSLTGCLLFISYYINLSKRKTEVEESAVPQAAAVSIRSQRAPQLFCGLRCTQPISEEVKIPAGAVAAAPGFAKASSCRKSKLLLGQAHASIMRAILDPASHADGVVVTDVLWTRVDELESGAVLEVEMANGDHEYAVTVSLLFTSETGHSTVVALLHRSFILVADHRRHNKIFLVLSFSTAGMLMTQGNGPWFFPQVARWTRLHR
ncbi:hypothetical protein BGW80DRAFT_1449675 [Lactifluus volemus]|nr:hypothetical protein BGW80DRAFT_1449675 [Lactifluus volemus]